MQEGYDAIGGGIFVVAIAIGFMYNLLTGVLVFGGGLIAMGLVHLIITLIKERKRD
jgi:hypothetical protein